MKSDYTNIIRTYKQHGFTTEDEIVNFNINLYLVGEKIAVPKVKQPRPLVNIDPETLTCVGYYNSISEASKKYRIANGTIYKATKNGNTCAGYYWRYL